MYNSFLVYFLPEFDDDLDRILENFFSKSIYDFKIMDCWLDSINVDGSFDVLRIKSFDVSKVTMEIKNNNNERAIIYLFMRNIVPIIRIESKNINSFFNNANYIEKNDVISRKSDFYEDMIIESSIEKALMYYFSFNNQRCIFSRTEYDKFIEILSLFLDSILDNDADYINIKDSKPFIFRSQLDGLISKVRSVYRSLSYSEIAQINLDIHKFCGFYFENIIFAKTENGVK